MADKKDSKGQPGGIARYFRETTGELRKVSWPTWPEARNLTFIVLGVLVVTAIVLGAVDYVAANVLNWAAGL